MFRRNRSRKAQRSLTDLLREEALQSRPAFSESLHRRLRESLPSLAARRVTAAPTSLGRPVWALAGVALASLLLCAGIAWYGVVELRRGSQRQAQAAAIAALTALPESAHVGIQEIDRLAGAIISLQPWAGLDQDAQLAANALAECFPLQSSRTRASLKQERLD